MYLRYVNFNTFSVYVPWQVGFNTFLLLVKEVGRESDIHSISPKTPAPQYQPIERKKRKGIIVEDYSKDRAA